MPDLGVKSESAARCSQKWQYDDVVQSVELQPQGLVIRVENTGARGREHRIIISYELLDRIAANRSACRGEINELLQIRINMFEEISGLKREVRALKGMLDDISKIAVGAPYAMEPEEELTDA